MSCISPVDFHHHLNDCNCELKHYDIDCIHALYINRTNKQEVFFNKEVSCIKRELVMIYCDHLEIPTPVGIPQLSDPR